MLEGATRIAIVDDDLAVRKALARLLSASSFDVTTYGSAREFIDSENPAPQCLVLDLQMPEVSGLDLQHHLRRCGREIPTIFITAFNEPGLRERCLSAGASALLIKPLSGKSIISAIHSAVGHVAGAREG
jgi:FixJ family two-component response regulator